jgi:hypothetical protein
VVLLPLALAVGTQAGARPRDAIAVAVVAALVTDRPAASLGLWSLVAATVNPPAGALLGAGAVVDAAWLHPLAPLAALPGVAALAYTGAQDGSIAVAALAVLATVTVARLWCTDAEDVVGGEPSPATLAAIAVGAWLALAPETWGWAVVRASAAGLDHWGTAVLVAGVAAAVGAFVSASFTETPLVVPDVEVADPAYRPGDPRWALLVALASLVVLAIAGVALVASVVS